MKPTTEQIIDWGRTALNETGALIPTEWNLKLLEAICSAAYKAGRKDENEACEKLHEEMWASSVSADSTVEAFNGALKGYARAIRAKREQ